MGRDRKLGGLSISGNSGATRDPVFGRVAREALPISLPRHGHARLPLSSARPHRTRTILWTGQPVTGRRPVAKGPRNGKCSTGPGVPSHQVLPTSLSHFRAFCQWVLSRFPARTVCQRPTGRGWGWHKALVVGSVSLWRRLLASLGGGGGLKANSAPLADETTQTAQTRCCTHGGCKASVPNRLSAFNSLSCMPHAAACNFWRSRTCLRLK